MLASPALRRPLLEQPERVTVAVVDVEQVGFLLGRGQRHQPGTRWRALLGRHPDDRRGVLPLFVRAARRGRSSTAPPADPLADRSPASHIPGPTSPAAGATLVGQEPEHEEDEQRAADGDGSRHEAAAVDAASSRLRSSPGAPPHGAVSHDSHPVVARDAPPVFGVDDQHAQGQRVRRHLDLHRARRDPHARGSPVTRDAGTFAGSTPVSTPRYSSACTARTRPPTAETSSPAGGSPTPRPSARRPTARSTGPRSRDAARRERQGNGGQDRGCVVPAPGRRCSRGLDVTIQARRRPSRPRVVSRATATEPRRPPRLPPASTSATHNPSRADERNGHCHRAR